MARDEVIPTKCVDWSLNCDRETKKLFWWHKTYSISIWNANLFPSTCTATSAFPPSTHHDELCTVGGSSVTDAAADRAAFCKYDDAAVWAAFITYQLSAVYKVCSFCKQPEGNVDLSVCCYCGATVHSECSIEATSDQMRWKAANKGFERHLRVCPECDDAASSIPKRCESHSKKEKDNARRAVLRAIHLESEFPAAVNERLHMIRDAAIKEHTQEEDEALLDSLRQTLCIYFQPGSSSNILRKSNMDTKGGGIGVVAVAAIPAYTVVGVYPGYEDPLSGEQVKLGRPSPKYSLVDLNCANYYNSVFTEFQQTFTPFVNEPNESEKSNCAWIQEPVRPVGRLSIMTVRDIAPGEELLIGYGPLYPRDYPHAYDAYAFHSVDGFDDPPCLALWHWTSLEEKDSEFVCYIGYDKVTNTYSYWETEDEARSKAATATGSAHHHNTSMATPQPAAHGGGRRPN